VNVDIKIELHENVCTSTAIQRVKNGCLIFVFQQPAVVISAQKKVSKKKPE